MKVDLNLLDKETLREIPMSLRIQRQEVEIDDLPPALRYKISDFYENYGAKSYTPSGSYDIKPIFSEKNDFQTLNTSTQAVLEYLKNYLEVPLGAYPFDPSFGNSIKNSIQKKDTELRNTLLSNQLESVAKSINDSFDSDVVIRSANVRKKYVNNAVRYFLYLEVDVDDVEAAIEILGD